MTDENVQRRPYGSFDPREVLDPSRALAPVTVQVNEVRVAQGFWPKMRRVAARVPFAREALSATTPPATPRRPGAPRAC